MALQPPHHPQDRQHVQIGWGPPAVYIFGGQTIAQAMTVGSTRTLTYLHGDHLGSIALATTSTGVAGGTQEFTPWGEVRSGTLTQTKLNYTGQLKDDTGLLYYHARYYDPVIARFVSTDSIVPGAALGNGGTGTIGMDSQAATRGLTVDFHESGFVSELNLENASTQDNGFWFQLGPNPPLLTPRAK